MAFARVVSFEDVPAERMEEVRRQIEGGRPDGLPATEIIVLRDADAQRSLVVVFFDSEEDYATGDAFLDAMPSDETPGRRTSVSKYEVALRMTV